MYNQRSRLLNRAKIVMDTNNSYGYRFRVEYYDPCNNKYIPVYGRYVSLISIIYYTEDITGDGPLLASISINLPLIGNISPKCRVSTLGKNNVVERVLDFLKNKFNVSEKYVEIIDIYQVYYWSKPWVLSNYWCVELWAYGIRKYYMIVIIDPSTGEIYDYAV